MEILFTHTWIMFIAMTFANGIVLKYRSKKHITRNSELKKGYDNYFKGWIFYGNIPWVIMMIGSLSGMTQGTFDYLNPRSLNPIVLAFHFSIIVLWILSVRWIYFKNGAEFIETHPGLLQKTGFSGTTNVTAKQIKQFLPLMLFGGLIGMIIMWVMDVPANDF